MRQEIVGKLPLPLPFGSVQGEGRGEGLAKEGNPPFPFFERTAENEGGEFLFQLLS